MVNPIKNWKILILLRLLIITAFRIVKMLLRILYYSNKHNILYMSKLFRYTHKNQGSNLLV